MAVERPDAGNRDGAPGAGGTSGASGVITGRGGSGGAPAPLLNIGVGCATSSQCLSGQGVDGVCCETACNGPCQSCVLSEDLGRCKPSPAEQDPENDCETSPLATCGHDGVCDGMGACRFHPTGTVCGMPKCEGATEYAANLCDGKGTCLPAATKSCAPAVCLGESCGAPCATHRDCQAGFFCDSGTCRMKREKGTTCTEAAQCMSGFCTEGVCCSEACMGKCRTCKQEGAVGTCTFFAAESDPRDECVVQNITTCGNAGGCDGKGACRLHPVGTFCGHPSCAGSTEYGMRTCDGMGRCRQGTPRSCAPYNCNGAVACWTVCANNEQCQAPATCNIHTCAR
ncbi:MAG TPA: hypothetical protein VGF45_07975 [Polyangia bacterium]